MNSFEYFKTISNGGWCDRAEYCSAFLITNLSEEELKSKLRDWAETNYLDIPRFFIHMANTGNGVYIWNEGQDVIDCIGEDEHYDLSSMTEQDVYSEKRYSEILKERKIAKEKEIAKKAAEAEQRKRSRDLKEIEEAKRILKVNGWTVTK